MSFYIDSSDNLAQELIKQSAKKQEEYILSQLNEFISRGLIVVERTQVTFIRDEMSNEIKISQGIRLVLKDQEYIEKLEKENKELKNLISVVKLSLGAINYLETVGE